jgi:hypothetical protein
LFSAITVLLCFFSREVNERSVTAWMFLPPLR